MARPKRTHDIVLFGATSFVGQILTRHLVERHPAPSALTWAVAGRNADKLATVAADAGAEVDQLVVDADDETALAEMCAHTNLVISTVGPYSLYGSKLVAAVVEAGIDYVDLTGEPQWMQRMIDRYQERAVETGARLVHACGFDSVPSDMGVWFLQRESQRCLGEPCTSISMVVERLKGGASGGTIASMMNMLDEVSADPGLRSVLGNPYALAVAGDRSGPSQPNVTLPEYDEGHATWLAPFVMAPTNTRVVFRTHSLLGRTWGNGFTYGEAMAMGDGMAGRAKALAMSATLGSVMGAASVETVRRAIGRFLPEPGEGPSAEAQAAGSYDLRFRGTTDAGGSLTVQVTGDQDPGYGSTSKILAEAATTLMDSDVGGGFWTPATALGDPFIAALIEHAGLSFGVLETTGAQIET